MNCDNIMDELSNVNEKTNTIKEIVEKSNIFDISKIKFRPGACLSKHTGLEVPTVVLGWGKEWANGKYTSWEDYKMKKNIEKEELREERQNEFEKISIENQDSFSQEEYNRFLTDKDYTLEIHLDGEEEKDIDVYYYNSTTNKTEVLWTVPGRLIKERKERQRQFDDWNQGYVDDYYYDQKYEYEDGYDSSSDIEYDDIDEINEINESQDSDN